jgi:hypothetical protein
MNASILNIKTPPFAASQMMNPVGFNQLAAANYMNQFGMNNKTKQLL